MQVALVGSKMACAIPGARAVGPIAASLVPLDPVNIACYVSWLLILKLSGAKWTTKLAPTWGKAALWAVPFYFGTAIPLYTVLFLIMCSGPGPAFTSA